MRMDTYADQEMVPTAAAKPASRSFMTGAGLNIFLAIISGALAGLAFPPFELWHLGWVALVPLLIALRRTTSLRFAGYLALLFGMSLCAVSLSWMTAIFHGPLVIGIYFLASLPWLFFGLAYRVLSDRTQPWAVMALAPILWIALEWIRCEGWYFRFSWLQLGFTQLPLTSIAYPVVGVYGITFLIVMVSTALVISFEKRASRYFFASLGVVFIVAIASFSYRHNRVHIMLPKSDAGMIVQNETGDSDELRSLTLSSLRPDTRLVVWPEYAVATYPLNNERLLEGLKSVAREAHSTFVFGTQEYAPKGTPCDWLRRRGMSNLYYNTALVISPEGEILGKYYKTHPIQFFADGVPGRSYQPIETPVGRLGIAICYDIDYAHTTLRLVHNGAEVLVVPTMDVSTWGETQHLQHTRIAQARVAEVGRWTLRATSSGISQIVSPDGRVVKSIPVGESAAATGPFRRETALTPYARFMWLLPYICLGVSLLWVLSLISARIFRRHRDIRDESDHE